MARYGSLVRAGGVCLLFFAGPPLAFSAPGVEMVLAIGATGSEPVGQGAMALFSLAQAAEGVFDGARNWLRDALNHAPILVFGLGFLLLVPVLLVAGALLRPGPQDFDETIKLQRSGPREIEGVSTELAATRPVLGGGMLELVSPNSSETPQCHVLDSLKVARIGREDDNDLQIRLPTVHRYHAVVQHNADLGFEVTDLSGNSGNGVLVNGRRVQNARLRDGDHLVLGDAKLRFKLT